MFSSLKNKLKTISLFDPASAANVNERFNEHVNKQILSFIQSDQKERFVELNEIYDPQQHGWNWDYCNFFEMNKEKLSKFNKVTIQTDQFPYYWRLKLNKCEHNNSHLIIELSD